MKILILGGFGYLGEQLGNYLASMNLDVTLCGRQIPSTYATSNIKTFKIDWDDQASIELAVDSIDVIVNAAGFNSHQCILNPLKAYEFSTITLYRLLKQACQKSLKRYIYLSSAHIYRDPLCGEINEKSIPENLHPYAVSKILSEKVASSLCKSFEVECLLLRLSNVFGEPARSNANCWNLVVNNLCLQSIEEQEIKILNNSLQTRDFIPIGQFCQTLYELITYPRFPNLFSVLNLGSGKNTQ